MATLQLPEGYTVRKVKGVLKVVPMRKRVVIAKKQMLNAVRSEYCGEFDWQESLKDTVLANREAVFTVDEMYAALESVSRVGDDQLDSKERVARRLEGLSQRTCQIKLEKVAEQTYKFAWVG